MRLHKSPPSMVESAFKAALESNLNEEDDHEFRNFMESISVTTEELAALISTPELSSIHEVRQYLQQGKRNSHPINQSPSEVCGARVGPPDLTSVTADHTGAHTQIASVSTPTVSSGRALLQQSTGERVS